MYGSIPESEGVARVQQLKMDRRAAIILAAGAALTLGAVAIADVMSKGASATALASFPAQRMPLMRTRNGMMLAYDGALGPLYTEGEDPVVEYKWSGVHSKGYDPEFQNAFKDLPMKNVDIKAAEPDREFYMQAPHSMETSCDKTGGCFPEENVLDYLPAKEAKSMATRFPSTFPEENHAFDNMPLDY